MAIENIFSAVEPLVPAELVSVVTGLKYSPVRVYALAVVDGGGIIVTYRHKRLHLCVDFNIDKRQVMVFRAQEDLTNPSVLLAPTRMMWENPDELKKFLAYHG